MRRIERGGEKRARSGEISKILGQPAAAIKPSESAFDNPTSRQKLEPFCPIGAFDDFDLQMRRIWLSLLKDRALISAISKELCKNGYNRTKWREQARRRHDLEYRLDAQQHEAAGLTYRQGYGASCP